MSTTKTRNTFSAFLLSGTFMGRLLPGRARSSKPGPEETMARLRQLVGGPLLGVDRSDNWTLALRLPGWEVGLADVAATAWASLVDLTEGTCRLVGVGRYGRFWWLSFTSDDPDRAQAVVLGSRLFLTPSPGGGEFDLDQVDVQPGYSRV
jgi:hypothetical protein